MILTSRAGQEAVVTVTKAGEHESSAALLTGAQAEKHAGQQPQMPSHIKTIMCTSDNKNPLCNFASGAVNRMHALGVLLVRLASMSALSNGEVRAALDDCRRMHAEQGQANFQSTQ